MDVTDCFIKCHSCYCPRQTINPHIKNMTHYKCILINNSKVNNTQVYYYKNCCEGFSLTSAVRVSPTTRVSSVGPDIAVLAVWEHTKTPGKSLKRTGAIELE